MIRAIEHITITTGASRMSSRTEVESRVLETLRRALARDGVVGDWRIENQKVSGGFAFGLKYRGALIAQCWLCIDRSMSDRMWEEAAETALDERVILSRPKGIPWLAASIAPSAISVAMTTPSALVEAGDLERCVAWALIDEPAK